ncbi:NUDIX hydrolase [Candidatus Poribacteria bacterium]|nr:NUDIX hydrolase [Candidatus Poribacteria bacterium]
MLDINDMEIAFENRKEITSLTDRYGQPEIIDAILPTDYLTSITNSGRKSEVISAIIRPNGNLILITKPFYPEGTYRLPSGGIEVGENIESALYREIHEETGLQVKIVRFVAIIRYNITATSQNESVVLSSNFTSYLFLVKEISGELVCNDANEQISAFKEIAPEELESIIAHLQNIKEKFEGWAQFRAVAHKAMLNFYRNLYGKGVKGQNG